MGDCVVCAVGAKASEHHQTRFLLGRRRDALICTKDLTGRPGAALENEFGKSAALQLSQAHRK